MPRESLRLKPSGIRPTNIYGYGCQLRFRSAWKADSKFRRTVIFALGETQRLPGRPSDRLLVCGLKNLIVEELFDGERRYVAVRMRDAFGKREPPAKRGLHFARRGLGVREEKFSAR